VIVRLAMGWRDWRYLLAKSRGYALPHLIAVPALGAVVAEHVLAGMPDTEPVVPVSPADEDFPVGEPQVEPTPAGALAHLAAVPQPRFAPAALPVPPATNGNGHGPASSNGHAGTAGHGPGDGHGHQPPNGTSEPQDGGPAVSDPWSDQ
jgi:hypothetical protein